MTIRIEEEPSEVVAADAFVTDDPAFGIWRDRGDLADPAAYLRCIRAPRFNREGLSNES